MIAAASSRSAGQHRIAAAPVCEAHDIRAIARHILRIEPRVIVANGPRLDRRRQTGGLLGEWAWPSDGRSKCFPTEICVERRLPYPLPSRQRGEAPGRIALPRLAVLRQPSPTQRSLVPPAIPLKGGAGSLDDLRIEHSANPARCQSDRIRPNFIKSSQYPAGGVRASRWPLDRPGRCARRSPRHSRGRRSATTMVAPSR